MNNEALMGWIHCKKCSGYGSDYDNDNDNDSDS